MAVQQSNEPEIQGMEGGDGWGEGRGGKMI